MDTALINKISTYLASQPVEKAWIFGSFARSEQDYNSDIDILVRFNPNANITLFKYVHIINELEKLTGKKVDLVEYGQLKPFAEKTAKTDKILIYERKAQG